MFETFTDIKKNSIGIAGHIKTCLKLIYRTFLYRYRHTKLALRRWPNVGPTSALTLGQRRHTNVGPTWICQLPQRWPNGGAPTLAQRWANIGPTFVYRRWANVGATLHQLLYANVVSTLAQRTNPRWANVGIPTYVCQHWPNLNVPTLIQNQCLAVNQCNQVCHWCKCCFLTVKHCNVLVVPFDYGVCFEWMHAWMGGSMEYILITSCYGNVFCVAGLLWWETIVQR